MKLWGLKENGKLMPVALRTRDDVRGWAARRMMSGADYNRIDDIYFGHAKAMRLWEQVQYGHPTARIVRLRVNGDGDVCK